MRFWRASKLRRPILQPSWPNWRQRPPQRLAAAEGVGRRDHYGANLELYLKGQCKHSHGREV
jgi:hypothetical protein